jgi:hypothetical protein
MASDWYSVPATVQATSSFSSSPRTATKQASLSGPFEEMELGDVIVTLQWWQSTRHSTGKAEVRPAVGDVLAAQDVFA